MSAKVTVAVPIYNMEAYLEECVDSVLAQTYENIEILLVDDGSTDRSAEICDRYAEQDGRVRAIRKENGGVSSARNAALDAATGDYILFVDSDDTLNSDAIETMVTSAEQNNADLVAANLRSFSENGTLKAYVIPIQDGVLAFDTADLLRIRTMIGSRFSFFCLANLYKVSLIRRCALRFEDMKKVHSEDQLFNYCYFLMIHRAAFLHTSLYNYRVRTCSLSHDLKPVDLLNRRFTLIRCLQDFVARNNLPRQSTLFYIWLCWNYFIDGCSALGTPVRVVDGLKAIEPANRKPFRKMLWHILCGKAGRQYIRAHKMNRHAALYFRFMVLLLLLGKYDRPAETYLSH